MSTPTKQEALGDKPPRVNKYARTIKGVQVDFYDIARAFGVTDPAIAHALKKLLRYGCGEKPLRKDVDEAIYSLERWKEDDAMKAGVPTLEAIRRFAASNTEQKS